MKGLGKVHPPDAVVLKDIWLSFLPGAKIGVLGLNGSGKSSLLRIMAGEDHEFIGEAFPADGISVGFLPQEPRLDASKDVKGNVEEGVAETKALLDRYDELNMKLGEDMSPEAMDKLLEEQGRLQDRIDAVNAWDIDSQLELAMDALRCPPPDADVSTLSGGERRRVALCRLLLKSPDLLLLDEPTNHLDAESVAWLERFLKEYKGTVVAVTHDRYFLDNAAEWILELDRGSGIPWKGNYSSWLDQKQQRLAQEEKSESKRQKTLARELEWIRMSPRARQSKGKARLNAYEQLLNEDSAQKIEQVEIYIPPGPRLGDLVVESRGLRKAYGDQLLMDDLSFTLPRGGIVGVIGPNGAGKTTAFNVVSGMFPPDAGDIVLAGRKIGGLAPETITRAGVGRSFQITNLFPALSVEENIRLAVQASHPARFNGWASARAIAEIERETAGIMSYLGVAGIEQAEAGALSYGGQRLLDMGLALATKPKLLLLDEPLAGLAAAERERIANLVKKLSADLPVLLVEHDIDRVFKLADHVTVMNDGKVLVDGTVEAARSSKEVQEVYIGSGAAHVAAKPRETAASTRTLLSLDKINTYYGKSHILHDVSLNVHENEIVALLGRNGAGKSTLLKSMIGIAPPKDGLIKLDGTEIQGLSSARIARLGVGYVPQGRALFAGMSVAHNLELGRLKRQTGAGVRWELDRILEHFPRLEQRLGTSADYLSGGEQQMVAVARALSGNVRVLLLDEPFEGLAPAVIEQLFQSFDRLRREVAIVIVDHHLDLALALSDRTVALERGQVTWTGTSKTLRDDSDLRRKVLWL
jgi:ABC-type branched-subunit amino acid transport system ATPase component